jgi:hypothetical protein
MADQDIWQQYNLPQEPPPRATPAPSPTPEEPTGPTTPEPADIQAIDAYVAARQGPSLEQRIAAPVELPKVAAPTALPTTLDEAALDQYMQKHMGVPAEAPVTQKLPEFAPETKLDITTGVQERAKPLYGASQDEVAILDDYTRNMAEKRGLEYMQRARQLAKAVHDGEVNNLPEEWVHDLMQRVHATTPSSWQQLIEMGKGAADMVGIPTDIPESTLGKLGAAASFLSGTSTYTALTKDLLAAGGYLGGAEKTAEQTAKEWLKTPTSAAEAAAPLKAAAIYGLGGIGEFYPTYKDMAAFVSGLLPNQMAGDPVAYMEDALREHNYNARNIKDLTRQLSYTPGEAPGTEATAGFVGGSLPYAILPEFGGGEFSTRLAQRALEPLISRAVPVGAAVATKAAQVAGPLVKAAPRALGEAGAAYAAHWAAGAIGAGSEYHTIASVGSAVATGLGMDIALGKPTIKSIARAFVLAAPSDAERVLPALGTSAKTGRPFFRAMQDGMEQELNRLSYQETMIRGGADAAAKTDAKMPDGVTNVFNAKELGKNTAEVRDEIAAQRAKFNSLNKWADWERLFSDTLTAGGAAVLGGTPTGLVLGGVNALEAPPDQTREAFHTGFRQGIAMHIPMAPGMISRAWRENAVRDLTSTGRKSAVVAGDPDFAADRAAKERLATDPEGRLKMDAMDQAAGILAKTTGTKVVGLTPEEWAARGLVPTPPLEPAPPPGAAAAPQPAGAAAMPPVKGEVPDAVFVPSNNRIYYNIAAHPDALGHDLTHPFERAIGENLVGKRIRQGLSDPADRPYMQAFLNHYMELMKQADPKFAGLSPDAQISEIFAELGRDILRRTPPAALYGGRSGMQIIQREAARVANAIKGRFGATEPTRVIPGALGAPEFPGTRAAMLDLLFGLGERAKYELPYPTRPAAPAGGAPAAPVTPEAPPRVFTPEEEAIRDQVIAGSKTKAGGMLGGMKFAQPDVEAAMLHAKTNGYPVTLENVVRMMLNKSRGLDLLHNLPHPPEAPPVTPQPPPAAPTPGKLERADYDKILAQHTDARAGLEAAAQRHAQQVGADPDAITWRTDQFGKSTISGTKLDPNDPFHQLLLERANLSPDALNNLTLLEDGIKRGTALKINDYEHAAREKKGETRAQREAARREAGAPERVAGEAPRETLSQSFIPTRIEYSPSKDYFYVRGFSTDKFLENAKNVIDWVKKNRPDMDQFTDVNDPRLLEYMHQLAENHANNRTGRGVPIVGTDKFKAGDPDPAGANFKIPKDYLDQINVMLGNDSARTGKKGLSPEQAAKQALAVANAKGNGLYFDPQTGEVNKLREQMGTEADKLHPAATESVRPELIKGGVSHENVTDEETGRQTGFTGDRTKFGTRGLPRKEFAAAGFMPPGGAGAGKIGWAEPETDVSEKGREFTTGVESSDGRFSIAANFYDKDTPQDYTLHDTQSGAKVTFDTVGQAKKAAQEWLTNPPPPPETPEQVKAKDLARTYKYRSTAEYRASRWGADVVENPDGTFSLRPRTTGGAQFMPPTGGFYAKSAQIIDDKMPEKGEQTVGQVKAMLRNNGVGKNELEWSGMNLLDDNQKMDKAGFQGLIRDNLPNITTTTLGGGGRKISPDMRAFLDRTQTNVPDTAAGWLAVGRNLSAEVGRGRKAARPEEVPLYRRLAEEAYVMSHSMPPADRRPQYQQYSLPGGDNYQEMLIHQKGGVGEKQVEWKQREDNPDVFDSTNAYPGIYRITNMRGGRYILTGQSAGGPHIADEFPNLEQAKAAASALEARTLYASPHFSGYGANLLGHLRMDDRTTTGGNNMRFLEEAQSDWGQAIREKGVKGPVDPKSLQMAESGDLWSFTNPKTGEAYQVSKPTPEYLAGKTGPEYVGYSGAPVERNEGMARLRAASFFEQSGVADMPFKGEAWKKLLMRQAIKSAVEDGKDSIGWTTGTQQADRYNLSQHINSLMLAGHGDGTFNILVVPKGDMIYRTLETDVPYQKLPSFIGKELASKVTPDLSGQKRFENVDLKVGGEGLKGFYDRELVNIANDIGKKFGAKVQDAQIPTGRGEWTVEVKDPDEGWMLSGTRYSSKEQAQTVLDSSRQAYPNHEYRMRQTEEDTPETVHELPITSQMRESVQTSGQPLFMPPGGAEGYKPPTPEETEAIRARGMIGSPGLWDQLQTSGQAKDLAEQLGVDAKKRFYEQKPDAQQKITYHFLSQGAQFMPPTTREVISNPVKDLDLSKDENFDAVDHVVPVKGSEKLLTSVDTAGERHTGEVDPKLDFTPALYSPDTGEHFLEALFMPARRIQVTTKTGEPDSYYIPGTLIPAGIDPKTKKGEEAAVRTHIMYLAAHEQSGVMNVCFFATDDCSGACLGKGGMGSFDSTKLARINKTKFWAYDPETFLAKLDKQLTRAEAKCKADGMQMAVRLNGTSDILWEKTGIMEKHPNIQFYDYTKYPYRLRSIPDNYNLTYSYTGKPGSEAFSRAWHEKFGVNTAVVFAGGMPAEFMGRPVIDGDVTDLRFKDPKGVIVGLHTKGPALKLIVSDAWKLKDGTVTTKEPPPEAGAEKGFVNAKRKFFTPEEAWDEGVKNKQFDPKKDPTKTVVPTPFVQYTEPQDVAIPYIDPRKKADILKGVGLGEDAIDAIKDDADYAPKADQLKYFRGNPFLDPEGTGKQTAEGPKGYKRGGIVGLGRNYRFNPEPMKGLTTWKS